MTAAEISFINDSLAKGAPFALVLLPGADSPLLWSDVGCPSGNATLRISPWLSAAEGSVCNLDDSSVPPMNLEEESTDRDHYIFAVKEIARRCGQRKGKTVYSRIECGEVSEGTNWGETADRLFRLFPDTLRFIYYTPHTLGWLGATPEVLLDFDKTSGHFSTMSLAGTRRVDSPSEWDEKNVTENRFVTDFIAARLKPYSHDVTVSDPLTLRYGPVEHLLHHISGSADACDIQAIISAIDPTPALCGFPKEDAVSDINELEIHRRNCYGGYIAIETDTRYIAFVNLRCVQFSGNRFCAYGGGGITESSVPETELAETSAKMSRILSIIHDDRSHNESSYQCS